MKRLCVQILLPLISGIFLCISVSYAGAETAAAAPLTAESNNPPIVIEALATETNAKTVRLFPFDQIPDSAEIRKTISRTWLSAPIESVMALAAQVYTDSKGNVFTVSGKYADDTRGCYVISIVPQLTDYGASDMNLVPQGTWMIYRNAATGVPVLIKIYPRENPALSIRLRPAVEKASAGKSFMNICLFNAYVCKDIAVGIPFDMLYGISLSHLKELTDPIIPWNLFNPPHSYNAVESMSNSIAGRLYQLVYLKDGGFDHEGKPVYISSSEPQSEFEINAALNIDQTRAEVIGGVDSAGFAKWIIDGIIRPVAGQGSVIESLKLGTDVPKTHFTQPVLHQRNLFFGLDWIRNLGAAALSLNLKRTVYPAASGLDVNICPFSLTVSASPVCSGDNHGHSAFSGYEKYAGYQTSYLSALFYYLAITEPGHFYLGCINAVAGNPPIRTYNDIAVFFPYFDLWGAFHLDIYEGGVQVPVEEFMEKYQDTYTAVVRVRVPETGLFNP
ncbi:MAG: hypothetical protein P1P65_09100 [Treponema sp.]